jgi:methylphosphotriester-DNA--protein-cysteine methyltransferase
MDRRVAQLIEAIRAHSGAMDWNLEHACRELKLGISPAYAARLFHRNTGMGLREYAKQQRFLTATKHLMTTELPIKVIAAGLGYRRVCDFTRFFTKQQSLSPAKFRAAGTRS